LPLGGALGEVDGVLLQRLARVLGVGDIQQPREVVADVHLAACPRPSAAGRAASEALAAQHRHVDAGLRSSGRTVPPCWSSSASSRCAGSMMLWSRPDGERLRVGEGLLEARVSLSMRMQQPVGLAQREIGEHAAERPR
jgi:hypothetical protein